MDSFPSPADESADSALESTGLGGLTADDPLAALQPWIADGRVDEAARARVRQRWLEAQANEDATLAGVLLDLAERERPVVARLSGGRVTRGPIVALGADFAVVREDRLGDVLIAHRALVMVRSAPGAPVAAGHRPVALAVVMAEALHELAAERPLVLVGAGGEETRGELQRSGRDLITVGLDGDRREVVHIATAAIDSLVVLA